MSMTRIFQNPVFILASITVFAAAALLAALASEAFLGLEPCILCIYQRWPYAAVIGFGVIGLALKKQAAVPRIMAGLSGLAFLINSGIATYHTGVEQKWWRSAVEGCAVPNFGDTSGQSLLDNILSAPTARCDEIPWQDPIIGLSMANYNVVFCLVLALVCFYSVYRLGHTQKA